jgi:KDO2-lipid IV(A) lauroyltransferase
MGKLWRLIAPLTGRQQVADKHLQLMMPELSQEQRQSILLHMWDNLGQTFAEGMFLKKLMAEPDRIIIENKSVFDQAMAEEKGVILVAAHFGNWEVMGIPIAHFGYEAAALYQAVRNPYLDKEIRDARQNLYHLGMLAKGHKSLKKAMSLLRAGHIVAMMADQREHKGVTVPVFGHEAPSTPFPAMLALRYEAPIVAGFVYRTGPCRFRVELEAVTVCRDQDNKTNIANTTADIQARFEKRIRKAPHLWMWAHRRWQRKGEPVPFSPERKA